MSTDAPPGVALLTVTEVARLLRQSRSSVYRHTRTGTLPALRVGKTGPLRFEPEAVERLLRPARETRRRTT